MNTLDALMRRFTIQLRMLGAIVIVVLLLLAVGGAGMGGMYRMQSLSQAFVDDAFADSIDLNELQLRMCNQRRVAKDIVIH